MAWQKAAAKQVVKADELEGHDALFRTHYINDMSTQDGSTAGLTESIKYSASGSSLRSAAEMS